MVAFPNLGAYVLGSNEQTLESDGMLEFIRARAADPPSEFSAWDQNSANMRLKVICGYIQAMKQDERIPDWVDLTDRDPNNYGEESTVQQRFVRLLTEAENHIGPAARGMAEAVLGLSPDDPLRLESEALAEVSQLWDGLIPKWQAPLPLEVQQALYDFLIDVCEALADKDASKDEEESSQDGDGDEAMPDAEAAREMGKLVRALDTPWRTEKPGPGASDSEVRRYLQSCRDASPFTAPIDINWDFVEQIVHDRLRVIENDLLGMREDPGYFAKKMQENRENHLRQVKPITRASPGMSEGERRTLNVLFPRNIMSQSDSATLYRLETLKWIEDSARSMELSSAITQRIITHEVWSTCFRYVTELRENWEEYRRAEEQTGQFPADALMYIHVLCKHSPQQKQMTHNEQCPQTNPKCLVNVTYEMTLRGIDLPTRIYLRCDKAMRTHYERNVAHAPFQMLYRDNATSSDLQKLACMLWVVQSARLGANMGLDNITEDMAEIVEKNVNKFSDLNKGFMADFQAARDVAMEVGKMLTRHNKNYQRHPTVR